MRIEDVYPRKYATGEDFAGKAVTLTIREVVMESMCPKQGAPIAQKPVIYFHGAKKAVVMGRPLWVQIAAILGSDDTNTWSNKRIQLYPERMIVGGQAKIAIRARQAPEIPATMAEKKEAA
jgi:hypothetical protein